MRGKRIWWIVSCLVIPPLLVVSCAPAAEEDEAAIPPQAEEETAAPVEAKADSTVTPITATELYLAYKDDDVEADARFKGGILEVTGIVYVSRKDAEGVPYVSLADGSERPRWSIKCMFSGQDEPQLARLSRGEEVTIRGNGDGCEKVWGYVRSVLIRECSLVD